MTAEEYRFLIGDPEDEPGEFYDVGETCYEQGWIDVFGFVTPKAQKEMEEYERQQTSEVGVAVR